MRLYCTNSILEKSRLYADRSSNRMCSCFVLEGRKVKQVIVVGLPLNCHSTFVMKPLPIRQQIVWPILIKDLAFTFCSKWRCDRWQQAAWQAEGGRACLLPVKKNSQYCTVLRCWGEGSLHFTLSLKFFSHCFFLRQLFTTAAAETTTVTTDTTATPTAVTTSASTRRRICIATFVAHRHHHHETSSFFHRLFNYTVKGISSQQKPHWLMVGRSQRTLRDPEKCNFASCLTCFHTFCHEPKLRGHTVECNELFLLRQSLTLASGHFFSKV